MWNRCYYISRRTVQFKAAPLVNNSQLSNCLKRHALALWSKLNISNCVMEYALWVGQSSFVLVRLVRPHSYKKGANNVPKLSTSNNLFRSVSSLSKLFSLWCIKKCQNKGHTRPSLPLSHGDSLWYSKWLHDPIQCGMPEAHRLGVSETRPWTTDWLFRLFLPTFFTNEDGLTIYKCTLYHGKLGYETNSQRDYYYHLVSVKATYPPYQYIIYLYQVVSVCKRNVQMSKIMTIRSRKFYERCCSTWGMSV